MKPLLPQHLHSFSERFLSFEDAEIRSVKIISASTIQINLITQDKSRDFDWISLTLEINGIKDASIVTESQLSFLDMSDGLSIIHHESLFACGIGKYQTIQTITDASCYVIAENIKYQEGLV